MNRNETLQNERFERALTLINAAHAEDPRRIEVQGSPLARELVYAQQMSSWLDRIAPEASEALRLAVRCQHLCRWRLARSDFPEGRLGYLAWRRACQSQHADLAGQLLERAGYDQEMIGRVQDLVRKRRMKSDRDAQTLEDVACLVFLDSELEAFASQHEEEKVIDILRKSWRKMSETGHEAAMTIAFRERVAHLVERALEEKETRESPQARVPD